MTNTKPWAAFGRFLQEVLEGLLDPQLQEVEDFFAAEAIFEFPFAPPGLPAQLNGAAAIRAHLAKLPEMIEIEEFSRPIVHRSEQPGVRIVEFQVRGRAVVSQRPYHQRYINVIQVSDGRIVHYRDYWNPLVVLEATAS
jgi:ketosteroid isomerase-like protein